MEHIGSGLARDQCDNTAPLAVLRGVVRRGNNYFLDGIGIGDKFGIPLRWRVV